MKNKAQVWVETVLYTLIGIALIGIVLGLVMPKITDIKDKMVVEQSINALNEIDQKINDALKAPGNERAVSLTLKRGSLLIETTEILKGNTAGPSTTATDKLVLTIDGLRKPYSELNSDIDMNRVTVKTTKKAKYSVNLTVELKGIDLTYGKSDSNEGQLAQTLTNAPLPYKLIIKNNGLVCVNNCGAAITNQVKAINVDIHQG